MVAVSRRSSRVVLTRRILSPVLVLIALLRGLATGVTVNAPRVSGTCQTFQPLQAPPECRDFVPPNTRIFVPDGYTQADLPQIEVETSLSLDGTRTGFTIEQLLDETSFPSTQLIQPCYNISQSYHCWQLYRPCLRYQGTEYPTYVPLCRRGCWDAYFEECFFMFDGARDNDVCLTQNPRHSFAFGVTATYPDAEVFDLRLDDGTVVPDVECSMYDYSVDVVDPSGCNEPFLVYAPTVEYGDTDHENDLTCRWACPLPIFKPGLSDATFVLSTSLGWVSTVASGLLLFLLVANPRTRKYPANLLICETVGIFLLSFAFAMQSFARNATGAFCDGVEYYTHLNSTLDASHLFGKLYNFEHQYNAVCAAEGVLSHYGIMVATMFWLFIALATFLRLRHQGAPIPAREQWSFFGSGFGVPVIFVLVLGVTFTGNGRTPTGRWLSNYRYSLYTANCFPSQSIYVAGLVTFYIPTGVILGVGSVLYGRHLYTIFMSSRRTSAMKSKSAKTQRQNVFIRIAVFEGMYLLTFLLQFALEIQFFRQAFDEQDTGGYLREFMFCTLRGYPQDQCSTLYRRSGGPVILVNFILSIQGLVIFLLFTDMRMVREALSNVTGSDWSQQTTKSGTTSGSSASKSSQSSRSTASSQSGDSASGVSSADSSVGSSSFDSGGASSSMDSSS